MIEDTCCADCNWDRRLDAAEAGDWSVALSPSKIVCPTCGRWDCPTAVDHRNVCAVT